MRPSIITFLFAVMVLVAAHVAPAQPNLPLAAGMLPGNADIVLLMDLTASNNAKSMLSLLPRAEMEKMLADEQAKKNLGKNAPAQASIEAAMRVAFDQALTGKFHSLAAGFTTAATPTPEKSFEKDYVVLLGNFKRADADALLKPFGVSGLAGDIPSAFPSEMANPLYASSPADNVLLLTSDSDWTGKAKTLQSTGAGLMAGGSGFSSSVASLGGRAPDALIYINGALVQKSFAVDPMAAMFLGPFTKAKGIVLSLHPADIPTVELHSAFADAQTASFASQFLTQSLVVLKSQIEGSLKESQDALEKQQLTELLQNLSSVKPEVSGNSAVVRYPFTKRPDKAEFQKAFLESFRSALAGDFAMPSGMPGGTQ